MVKIINETFIDLDKEKLKIIKRKIESGLREFEENPRQQWVSLRLEKPLLEKMLNIINNEQ